MEVRFIDTTFRDGSQSLWALGMRTGMIEATAEYIDRAGFEATELPVTAIFMKKIVRDLKEDPWEMARVAAKKMPRTPKACMAPGTLNPFGARTPREVTSLFYERLAATGALNRAQIFANTYGQMEFEFPWSLPVYRSLGFQIAIVLAYTISPRHTDEYYRDKTRAVAAFKPDVVYLEDQCGILTPDRARTLLPAMVEGANGLPVELHAHCTTGLAPLVYLEALKLGIRTLHTAVPPLAEGSSQPSIFGMLRNARLTGYTSRIDESVLEAASERLTAIARQEGLPIGAPLEYDHSQYVHQMPGGVISNLKHQLAQLRIEHRVDEVLQESVRVRKDLGYPIMVTPHSQFVSTQAAINVATGERYKLVIDELILFAQGVYTEDSGYTWMDQNLKDRLLGSPRARELKVLAERRQQEAPSLKQVRSQFGGPGVSDEEFLLRYIMQGGDEVEAMRAAGPYRQFLGAATPLLTLLQELGKHRAVRHIHIQRGADSLVVRNQALP